MQPYCASSAFLCHNICACSHSSVSFVAWVTSVFSIVTTLWVGISRMAGVHGGEDSWLGFHW